MHPSPVPLWGHILNLQWGRQLNGMKWGLPSLSFNSYLLNPSVLFISKFLISTLSFTQSCLHAYVVMTMGLSSSEFWECTESVFTITTLYRNVLTTHSVSFRSSFLTESTYNYFYFYYYFINKDWKMVVEVFYLFIFSFKEIKFKILFIDYTENIHNKTSTVQ